MKEIKIKPWKKVICFFFGHKSFYEKNISSKNITDDNAYILISNIGPGSVRMSITDLKEFKTEAFVEYKACYRCGIYAENYISVPTQLDKDEQMIKDIIT